MLKHNLRRLIVAIGVHQRRSVFPKNGQLVLTQFLRPKTQGQRPTARQPTRTPGLTSTVLLPAAHCSPLHPPHSGAVVLYRKVCDNNGTHCPLALWERPSAMVPGVRGAAGFRFT